jgi:hypothetical protein
VSRECGLVNMWRQDETEKLLNKLTSRHAGACGLSCIATLGFVPPNRNNLHNHNASFLHIGAFSYVKGIGESGRLTATRPPSPSMNMFYQSQARGAKGRVRRISSQITPSRQFHNRLDTNKLRISPGYSRRGQSSSRSEAQRIVVLD